MACLREAVAVLHMRADQTWQALAIFICESAKVKQVPSSFSLGLAEAYKKNQSLTVEVSSGGQYSTEPAGGITDIKINGILAMDGHEGTDSTWKGLNVVILHDDGIGPTLKLQQGYNTFDSDVARIALTGELNNVQAGDIVIISAKEAACIAGESSPLLDSLSHLNAREAEKWLLCNNVPEECASSSEHKFAYAAILKKGSAAIEQGGCNEEVVKLTHVFEDATPVVKLAQKDTTNTALGTIWTDTGTCRAARWGSERADGKTPTKHLDYAGSLHDCKTLCVDDYGEGCAGVEYAQNIECRTFNFTFEDYYFGNCAWQVSLYSVPNPAPTSTPTPTSDTANAGTTSTTGMTGQTCDTWPCQRDGLLPKSNAYQLTGQSDPECCEQSCRDWSCPAGMLLKDDPHLRIGTSDDACCVRETCERWNHCSHGKLLIAAAADIVGNSDAQCCEESCASFTCPDGLMLTADAAVTAGNTAGQCCEAQGSSTSSTAGLPVEEVQQALEGVQQSTGPPLPVEVSFIVSASLNAEGQPQNCDEVCLTRGKPCHDASLQRTIAEGETGRVNVMRAFLAAAFTCASYDTSCSEPGNCAEQGAPFVHSSRSRGSTQWLDGHADLCYYGNAAGNCTQRPNDASHRRLCACEDPEQATSATTTTSDNSFCVGIETPGQLGCDGLGTEHTCEDFYFCHPNAQWCNPCITRVGSTIGGRCGATAPQCQRPSNPR